MYRARQWFGSFFQSTSKSKLVSGKETSCLVDGAERGFVLQFDPKDETKLGCKVSLLSPDEIADLSPADVLEFPKCSALFS